MADYSKVRPSTRDPQLHAGIMKSRVKNLNRKSIYFGYSKYYINHKFKSTLS